MPSAKRLSSKFYICPRSKCLSLSRRHCPPIYTSHQERFIYWIIHAFAFSLPFPSYFRCLHPSMRLRLFQKKKKQQQQQQQQPALLHTGTYMFVDHKSKRLKSMDFIVSCSKWICLVLSRRLYYPIMLCEMNVQWKLFAKEYERTLIFDRSEGLNNTLRQY